jgi:ATP-dependent helicase/DNAse subunit B
MIKLSASSIKDWLQCPARYYYRVNYPESSIPTEGMALGTVVHKVIEDNWNNVDNGILQAEELIKEYGIKNKQKVFNCLDNFYYNYSLLLFENDRIEEYFKYKVDTDCELVGKMDRISNGVIYDWKTTSSVTSFIDNDPQFIIYYTAYKKLFNKNPIAVYYINLADNRVVQFKPSEYIEILYNEIIPSMIKGINQSDFYKKGLFDKFSCRNCNFKKICREDKCPG